MLKELRKARGLTQKQLAELSGVPQSRISLVESSRVHLQNITISNAAKLASALGLLIDDLYYQ